MWVRRDIWSRRFSLKVYQTPRNSAAATSEAGFFFILFCEFITAVTFPLSWHFPGNANSYINTMQENENIISSRFIWNFENTFFQIKLSEVIRCVEKAKINYTFIVIKWWSYKVFCRVLPSTRFDLCVCVFLIAVSRWIAFPCAVSTVEPDFIWWSSGRRLSSINFTEPWHWTISLLKIQGHNHTMIKEIENI